MSVTITETAPTKYPARCSKCGTAFTYELSDLVRRFVVSGEYVPCPSCGEDFHHPDQRMKRRG